MQPMRNPALWSLVFFVAVTAQADDWPQWRGSQRNGISPETGWLTSWPDGGSPNVGWRVSWPADRFGTKLLAHSHHYTSLIFRSRRQISRTNLQGSGQQSARSLVGCESPTWTCSAKQSRRSRDPSCQDGDAASSSRDTTRRLREKMAGCG